MDVSIFLKPLFRENNIVKYLTVDLSSAALLQPVIKDIPFEQHVYLFCKVNYVEAFERRLCNALMVNGSLGSVVLVNSKSNNLTAAKFKLSPVKRIRQLYSVQTNAGTILTTLTSDTHSFDEYLEVCVLFCVPVNELWPERVLITQLSHLQLTFPYFYILKPTMLEMEFVLDKMLQPVNTGGGIGGCDGIMMTDSAADVSHNGFIKTIDVVENMELCNPTALYYVITENSTVINFRPFNDTQSNILPRVLSSIPCITFKYGLESKFDLSVLANKLTFISIGVTFDCMRVFYIHLCVIDRFITELYKSHMDILNEYLDSHNETSHYFFYKSEEELIIGFVELYFLGGVFKMIAKLSGGTLCRTEQLHWIVMDDWENFTATFLDRVFLTKMENHVLPYINTNFAETFLYFNIYGLLIKPTETKTSLDGSSAGVGGSLIDHTTDDHSLNFNAAVKHVHPQYTTNLLNQMDILPNHQLGHVHLPRLGDLQYRSDAIGYYAQSNKPILVYTIFQHMQEAELAAGSILTDVATNQLSAVYTRMDNYKLSADNTSMFSHNTTSELYLFYKYLKLGVFLLPSFINTQHEPIYMECISHTTGHNTSTTDAHKIEPFITQPKVGGYAYGRTGYYIDETVSHIDFRLFYASILTTFNLSYENTIILNGRHLNRLMAKDDIIKNFISQNMLAMGVDDTEIVCGQSAAPGQWFIDNTRYICIFKDLEKIIGRRVVNLGRMVNTELYKTTTAATDVSSSVNKKLINILIGCLGNNQFKFQANNLYNSITALGRRIILYACRIINGYAQDEQNIVDFFNFKTIAPIHIDSILHVKTDGMYVKATEDQAREICRRINAGLIASLTAADKLDWFNNGDAINIQINYKYTLMRGVLVYNKLIYYLNNQNEIYPRVPELRKMLQTMYRRHQQNPPQQDDAIFSVLRGSNNVTVLWLACLYFNHIASQSQTQPPPSTNKYEAERLHARIEFEGWNAQHCITFFRCLAHYGVGFDDWFDGEVITKNTSLKLLCDSFLKMK